MGFGFSAGVSHAHQLLDNIRVTPVSKSACHAIGFVLDFEAIYGNN